MSKLKPESLQTTTSQRPELGELSSLGEELDSLLPIATSFRGLVRQVELLKTDVIRATEEIVP